MAETCQPLCLLGSKSILKVVIASSIYGNRYHEDSNLHFDAPKPSREQNSPTHEPKYRKIAPTGTTRPFLYSYSPLVQTWIILSARQWYVRNRRAIPCPSYLYTACTIVSPITGCTAKDAIWIPETLVIYRITTREIAPPHTNETHTSSYLDKGEGVQSEYRPMRLRKHLVEIRISGKPTFSLRVYVGVFLFFLFPEEIGSETYLNRGHALLRVCLGSFPVEEPRPSRTPPTTSTPLQPPPTLGFHSDACYYSGALTIQ